VTNRPAIIVHGGAWAIPTQDQKPHREGCLEALARGAAVLDAGGTSLDAVEAAVVYLEDDPTFDAGRGSFLTRDGIVELDAAIMSGRDLQAGSVACVTTVRNPVRLARTVLDSEHTMLVGRGAEQFAEAAGFERCTQEWLVIDRERERWGELVTRPPTVEEFFDIPRGTVGAVAYDADGNIAAATSTGGPPVKQPGRVGDSPIIGAGCYAANDTAGVSVTGWGEAFVRLVWSYRAALASIERPAQAACEHALSLLMPLQARGGVIMVDRNGDVGVAFNTRAMAFASRDRNGVIAAGP
jgi:L-asparaginase / beta-aspartyl-peptidase